MTAIPELCVVVLSYRNEGTVLGALDSLVAQETHVEVVLSHSGGGETPELVRSRYPEAGIVSSDRPRTPGAARNAGVAASRAPYVAFLAGDCMAGAGWAAGRLRRHRAGAGVVASAMAPPRQSAAALASFLIQHSYRMSHLRASQILRFGASYSRPLLERFGPFREDLPGEEDVELNGRLIGAGIQIDWAPDVVTEHAYPADARALVADGYRRGRMRRAVRDDQRPWPVLAARALLDGPAGVARALRPGSPIPAQQVARCCPLVAAGSLAYAAGVARAPQVSPLRGIQRNRTTAG